MQSCVDSFEELEASACRVLESFAVAVRPEELSSAEAARVMRAAGRLKNMAAAIEVLVAPLAAESPEFKGNDGGRGAAERMGRATGRTAKAAKRAVATGKTAAEQPGLGDAMRRGDLTAEQAERIADAAKANPGALDDLIAKARTEDAKGLRDACDRAKAAADPDPEARRRRIHAARRVKHWTGEDGSRFGLWSMTADAAAEIEAVMDAYTDAAFARARDEGRREPLEAYRADGLLAMARAAGGRRGDLPMPLVKQLVLRCDWPAYLRGHTHGGEVCEIRGLGPVPVEVAREWAANAFLKGLLYDGTDVMRVRHFGRRRPAALQTALDDRDQVCTDPGCNRSFRLEDDHEIPVAQGGVTSQETVHKRCGPSHREKTKTDNAQTRRLRRAGRLPPRVGPEPRTTGDPPSLFDQARRVRRRGRRRGDPPPEVGPCDDEGLDL